MVDSDEGFDCSLCYNFIGVPVSFKCKHSFCFVCSEQMILRGEECWKCPMCREKFNPYDSKNVYLNVKLLEKIVNKDKDKFKDAVKSLAKYRLNLDYKNLICFEYGNEHVLIKTDNKDQNKHQWNAYIRLGKIDENLTSRLDQILKDAKLEDYLDLDYQFSKLSFKDKDKKSDKYKISDIVDNVVFNLHPTFNPPSITVSKAPFELKRIGWGTFTIMAKITLKKEFEIKEKLEFDIDLQFQKDISISKKVVNLTYIKG